MNEKNILEKFLSTDLASTRQVFAPFRKIENAVYFPKTNKDSEIECGNFIYIPGRRNDRVLLVAHADTVFFKNGKHQIILENGIYRSGEQDEMTGIGADDRAGCAILYLLKDSGHSLLVLNGEELGSVAACTIQAKHKELYDELNNHQYMIEFDRRNASDYKVYNLPVSQEFKNFIEEKTGYKEADKSSSTDITILCSKICGVNLSIGYYDEHSPDEILVYKEWKHTLDIVRKMLEEPQKKFPLTTALKGDLTC